MRRKIVTVSLRPEVIQQLDDLSEPRGRSALVEAILEEGLAARGRIERK